jgi:GTP pyrophosphokinase
VHRRDCPNLVSADKDRLIEVNWTDRIGAAYNAGIKVIGDSQIEILSIVSGLVAKLGLNILSTNGRTDNKLKQSVVEFSVRINSKQELESLIEKLKQEPKITDVFRTAT